MGPILNTFVILQAGPTTQQEQGLSPKLAHIKDVTEPDAYKKGSKQ